MSALIQSPYDHDSAIDDTVIEGTHVSKMTHSITGTASDPASPTTLPLDSVFMSVLDNEPQPFVRLEPLP